MFIVPPIVLKTPMWRDASVISVLEIKHDRPIGTFLDERRRSNAGRTRSITPIVHRNRHRNVIEIISVRDRVRWRDKPAVVILPIHSQTKLYPKQKIEIVKWSLWQLVCNPFPEGLNDTNRTYCLVRHRYCVIRKNWFPSEVHLCRGVWACMAEHKSVDFFLIKLKQTDYYFCCFKCKYEIWRLYRRHLFEFELKDFQDFKTSLKPMKYYQRHVCRHHYTIAL